MFDKIGIMSRGEVVYFGSGQSMISYFTDMGYPCDRYSNPLDRYGNCTSSFLEVFNFYPQLIIKMEISTLYETQTARLDFPAASS